MAERNRYGVTQRGTKWIACPWIPGQGRHKWAGTFETEREATKAAIDKIEELRRLPANLETVETFAKRWQRDFPRPKQSTMDRYSSDALRFAKEVGEKKRLHEVTVPEARSYAQKHRHDLGALRAMYSDARRDGLVLENPFAELGIKKGPGRRHIVPITAEELGALAELARDSYEDDFGATFRAVVVFAAYSGLRPGELFGLDWDDIDFEEETIHVRRQFHKRRITLPKSGHKRDVYLAPPAAQALREMPRSLNAEHVFSGKEGQRIAQAALSTYWKPVRVAFLATLEPQRAREFKAVDGSLDFYSVTRHYCATFLIEEDVPSWIVAKQLGHEDGGRLVEKLYSHPSDRVAREKMRRVFDKPTPLHAVKEAVGG